MIERSEDLEESLIMPSVDIRSHFRNWVPHWLRMIVAFTILVPILLINGAYTGSNVDIVGAMGILSEDINMAFYASATGMAIAYLVVPRVRPIATAKTVILIVLLAQVILSFFCAITKYIELILFCSFWIGYFKGFSMSELVSILIPELSRHSGTRNEFYSKFYPITLGIGQLSMVLTAELAYQFQWQHMYYFMIVLLLIAMVAVVICMAYAKKLIRLPIREIDWISFFLISVCFMAILYVATYGKTNDWFASKNIIFATILIPVTGWIFIHRQLSADETPFCDLSVLKNRSSRVSYLFSFIFMFFASFNTLMSAYTTNILHLGSTQVSELYLYMIPGVIAGGFISYFFYMHAIRMAWLIFIGFACFTVATALLYFGVNPNGMYSDLYLPMFMRGIGMVILFVAFGVYSVQGLKLKQLIYNAFYVITSRSALAPAIAYGIIINWLYRLQMKNIMLLSQTVDFQNPLAVSKFNTSLKNALAQGWSMEDAHQIATNSVYTTIQSEATLVSIKSILGWMLIFGLVLLVIIMLYFFQFKPVKLMKVGNDMTN